MTLREFNKIKPIIAITAWVDESAIVTGDVVLGEDSSVWPLCSVRGDINKIRIGRASNIQDGCMLHVTHAGEHSILPEGAPLLIGDRVTVGHQAVLHGCSIEDECLIGMGAIVMDNAIIRSQALVAAGAVVGPGRELAGGYIWAGNPARQMRALTARELSYFTYSAEHYVMLKNQHQTTSFAID